MFVSAQGHPSVPKDAIQKIEELNERVVMLRGLLFALDSLSAKHASEDDGLYALFSAVHHHAEKSVELSFDVVELTEGAA